MCTTAFQVFNLLSQASLHSSAITMYLFKSLDTLYLCSSLTCWIFKPSPSAISLSLSHFPFPPLHCLSIFLSSSLQLSPTRFFFFVEIKTKQPIVEPPHPPHEIILVVIIMLGALSNLFLKLDIESERIFDIFVG